MEWTGERYLPTLPDPDISYEHWHRYLHATAFVSGKAVLDVASGEGFGSHLLAQSAGRVVGIDRCAEAVRHASAQYARPNLEFLLGDAGAIPVRGEQVFDVVVSFETIEHLDAEGQARFLGEVKRLLRPEGVFLVSTPNKLLYTDRPSFHNEFHLREFHLSEFQEFLARHFRHAGFLGQKVYPVSYLWPLDRPGGPNQEYQIGYANGCYRPMADDAKEVLYVLAICSDSPLDPRCGSLLVDLTGQTIHQRIEQAAQKECQNQALAADLGQAREQLAQRDDQIQVLTTALRQAQELVAQQEGQIQVLASNLGQVREQLAHQEGQSEALAAALGQAREQMSQQEGQIQVLTNALSEAREVELALRKSDACANRQAQILADQLGELTQSRSWRVAQFLRKARSTAVLPRVLQKRIRRPSDELQPIQPAETRPTSLSDSLATPGLNAETLSLVRAAAARHGVTSAVHAKDFIFKFVLTQGGMALPDAVNYYFDDGARSARKLADLIAKTVPSGDRPLKLLEFAAGYGCVTRHLSKYSEYELASCDIHSEAINFLTSHMGVKAISSTVSPGQFAPSEQFDIVFALSFFSHMPKASFGRWLKSLYGTLKAPGCLIFTTHGMASRKYMGNPPIPPDGFWFSASSEQEDLDVADYGLTITTPEYVRGEIERQIGAARVDSRLAYWWEHQDLWVVHREHD